MQQDESTVPEQDLVRVCAIADVAPGTMVPADIEGMPPLAIYNHKGHFFATSNLCTHEVARLTDGYFEGELVECPLHGGAFNIVTGEPVQYPCVKKLATFALKLIGGDLFVSRVGV